MKLSASEKERIKTQYGEWAVITGASSGIGLELAMQLANAGLNLILNSRSSDKLNEVKMKIQTKESIEIMTIACDISTIEGQIRIIEETRGLNIGLFIASAGFGTSGSFINNSIDSEINMLKLNVESTINLTYHFSHLFVNQKRGGIILISSILAFQGTPYSSNYAATKAYIQTFGEGLHEELKPFGVDVLIAAPGPVKSGFGSRANLVMKMSMVPSQIAVPILNALGRKMTVLPGMLSKFLTYSLLTVPRWGKIKIMKTIMLGMTKHQNK
jgi:short-subunit dehydrogenase